MIRGDQSDGLVHLTKGDKAAENFTSIFQSGRLRGWNGNIRGGLKCVCFSEAPISVLAQMLAPSVVRETRYARFGVTVKKAWLFLAGGRPVIYQPEAEFDLLDVQQRYRHVRYEPNRDIDHTAEREWRIHTDELPLDKPKVNFVVPSRSWEEKFMECHAGNQRSTVLLFDKDMAFGISKCPWHFVVPADLGIKVNWP